MRRFRKAKIIATLGPLTSTEEAITKLFEAGADVFRMNFSHGAHEDHQARLNILRSLEHKHGRPIVIILDLRARLELVVVSKTIKKENKLSFIKVFCIFIPTS